jgi:hypothetical protein
MNEQNYISQILNNVALLLFIPVIIGVLSSLITLWFTVWSNKKQKEDDEKQKYLNLVISTKNELEFYITMLKKLVSEVKVIITSLSAQTPALIPTYSLYPSFLEQAKLNLSGFNKNPDIVKRVGHCHFGLSHIQQRLELMKNELKNPKHLQILIANVSGFKSLVESNIEDFEYLATEMEKEVNQLKRD